MADENRRNNGPGSLLRDDDDAGAFVLPMLVIRGRVLFPGGLLRLAVGRPKSVLLIESLLEKQVMSPLHQPSEVLLAVFTQVEAESAPKAGRGDGARGRGRPHDPAAVGTGEGASSAAAINALDGGGGDNGSADGPPPPGTVFDSIYKVGCAARVVQITKASVGDASRYSVLVQGVSRLRIFRLAQENPILFGRVGYALDIGSPNDTRVKALGINLQEGAQALLEAMRARSQPRGLTSREVTDAVALAMPAVVADVLASGLGGSVQEKQAILAELSLEKRLMRALELVREQTQVLILSNKIRSEMEGKMAGRTREFMLRQQLKAIRDELGGGGGASGAGGGPGGGSDAAADAEDDELGVLQKALDAAKLPPDAAKAAARDLRRLKRMQPQQPEHTVVRNYLEVLSELPWGLLTEDRRDVRGVQAALDRDHSGLDKVKRRIVEYMAVRSLKADSRGSILCLVGPPGVGKTSLGRSVATALGRRFQRLSLGGVHDEAEIRGHRRTYIGAMPGSIVQALRKAGSRNPVMLLDEVDKLGTNFRGGDPASALLEVLDPEQNATFTDHYLNLPFDLSNVFFIATANQTDTIPAPLLDRMEVIHVAGYTSEEKLGIALRHLLPKQLREHGLSEGHVLVPPRTVLRLAAAYTREAGVRQLERELAAVCRHVALKVATWRDDNQSPAAQEAAVTGDGSGPTGGGAETGLEASGAAGDDDTYMSSGSGAGAAAGHGGGRGRSQLGPGKAGESAVPADSGCAVAAAAGATENVPYHTPFVRMVVTPEMLPSMLGPEKHESEVAARAAVPGVCTGLAWTPAGGELLFIECSSMAGKGALTLTGKLGETMKESAAIALTWIRSHEAEVCEQLGLDASVFPEDYSFLDLHVHVPAGGIPKDGPSAGVAIATALLSLLSGRTVDPLLAMTGELTLRGLVLPVGGVKDKVLAAYRGGIRHVVLPERNGKDLDDLPPKVRQEMRFSLASTLADVVLAAFAPGLAAAGAAAAADGGGGGGGGGGDIGGGVCGGMDGGRVEQSSGPRAQVCGRPVRPSSVPAQALASTACGGVPQAPVVGGFADACGPVHYSFL